MNIIRHKQAAPKKTGLILCFMILHILLAHLSFCQEPPGPNSPKEKRGTKWSTFIQGGYVYQFDTDMDNSKGSFTTDRFFVQPVIKYSLDYTRSYSFAFGYGYDGYDFRVVNGS